MRENRTEIDGVVQSVSSVGDDDSRLELVVQVRRSGPVEGYPDMLTANQPAEEPWVLLVHRDELPAEDLTGWRVHGCAAMAGPGVLRLVTTDPAPELEPPEGDPGDHDPPGRPPQDRRRPDDEPPRPLIEL
ncbi:hypothetical protein [Cellulomonas sp. WB94]|uniref:hypothetical protein n=1 Tax=Cellulomonas sp. WB94 TaxID=2173174 RepID=UPI0011B203C0|nr:hypothetical protein [Cellulomonas sp. WB94]